MYLSLKSLNSVVSVDVLFVKINICAEIIYEKNQMKCNPKIQYYLLFFHCILYDQFLLQI